MNLRWGIVPLVLCLCAMTLSSCALYKQYRKDASEKQRCFAACIDSRHHCSAVCDQDANLCNKKADAIAAVHFNHYRHQQRMLGAVVTEELNSYRDPLACLKPTCDCTLDYQVCVQSCRGKIYKRSQPVSPGA